jgi:hypothetical protein
VLFFSVYLRLKITRKYQKWRMKKKWSTIRYLIFVDSFHFREVSVRPFLGIRIVFVEIVIVTGLVKLEKKR